MTAYEIAGLSEKTVLLARLAVVAMFDGMELVMTEYDAAGEAPIVPTIEPPE